MGNFTLGRLLSVFLPGFTIILVFYDLFFTLSDTNTLTDFLQRFGQSTTVIASVIAIVIGLLVDALRRYWFTRKIFINKLNFYRLFICWYKPSFIYRKLRGKKLNEEEKSYSFWHQQYQDAYEQAYDLWLNNSIENKPQIIETAKRKSYNHILYGLRVNDWNVVADNKPTKKKITITQGQVWPILAIKQKEAFKFYQEYFLFDLSANLLIVSLIGFVFSLIGFIIYCIPNVSNIANYQLLTSSEFIHVLVYAFLYISFAQISTRLHLSQMRFFRFLLIYDTLDINSSKAKKE